MMTPTLSRVAELQTRFGEFQADLRSSIQFPIGIPGFEQCHEFLLLASDALAPLQCLHALSGPAASFLVIDPRMVTPSYRCELTPNDRQRLGAAPGDPLLWLATVALGPNGSASANLRAPIVINPERMLGYQVVGDDADYPLHHPLAIG